MRFGVIADVHANLPALESVLHALRRRGVDRYVSAGDLVGYGAWPNECVEIVAALDPICVAGNHDLIATGRLVPRDCVSVARKTLAWTQDVLRDDVRDYLAGLPLQAAGDGLLVAHGSLDDTEEYTLRPAQARRQLATVRLLEPSVQALVLGHTHRPAAYGPEGEPLKVSRATGLPLRGPTLVNPGAVGQSRELRVRARFLVLDLEDQSASFGATAYDVARCREALRRAGLPTHTFHLQPAPLVAAARGARYAACRAVGRQTGRSGA